MLFGKSKSDKGLEEQSPNGHKGNLTAKEYDSTPINWTPEERERLEKKFLRKLDARMSILVIIYILNYIDRNNVPAARENGLVRDLNLTGSEYPSLLSLLYVGYILFQVPSNMIVEKTGRPSLYLPACIIIWGLISTLFYLVQDFGGAVAARFFLGIVEAAFFPGAVFIISRWYTRRELAMRTTVLYCGSLISNAFGPLIAAGVIGGMNNDLGIPNWRWLFIIEGAITMFVGVITIFILPDFPHNSRGFTQEERKLAVLRMTEDAGESDSDDTTALKALAGALTDHRLYVMSLSLTAMVIGLAFNAFFPTLTGTLGYGRIETLLLAAPPFVFATIVAFLNARHSDKTGDRYWHCVWPLIMGIIGFIIAMSTEVLAARYVSLFLMAGSYASFTVFYSWISATFPRPPMRRSICIAFINAFSQLGNVSGSYVYPSKWGPTYRNSFGIGIAMFVFCLAGITFHRWDLQRLNKKIEAIENDMHANGKQAATLGGSRAGKIPTALDVRPGFRYML